MRQQFWFGFAVATTALGACAIQDEDPIDEAAQAVIASACTATISSQESAVTFGAQVHLSAIATCPGGAAADVQFLRRVPNSVFSVIQAYSAATSTTPTTQTVGANDFEVQVRTHGTTEAPATSNIVTVQVSDTVASCTSVKMTQPANGQSGFLTGAPVSMTGLAVCPVSTTAEYQFWFKPVSVSNYTIIPGYTSGTGSFTPAVAGDYNLTVVARSVGSHVQYQVRSAGVLIHVGAAPSNQPPIANNDSISTGHGIPATFDPRSNDTDGDSDALTITSAGPATSGAVTFTGTSVTYTPTAGFAGGDSLPYTISDGHGHSVSATVTITVTNNAPTTTDDTASTFQMTAVTIDPRTNDADLDSDALSVTAVGAATSGLTSFTGTGVTYTPGAGFVGTDTFSYTISDGITTASGNVTVTVADRAPIAVDDSTSTNINTAVTIGVLANDSDPDTGDAASLTSVGAAGHGTTLLVNQGCVGAPCGLLSPMGTPGFSSGSIIANAVRYTPAAGFVGTDSFSYTITDEHSMTATATVTVTVNDRAPTANADSVSTPSNSALTFDPTANDTDPDLDTLVIAAAGPAANGNVSFGDNTLTYTPDHNFIGSDTFSYTISDGHLTAIGSITVTVTNRNPIAATDAKSTAKNTPVSFDPTVNDSDADGGTLSVTAVGAATNGATGFSGNTVTYTPNSNFAGTDSFSYSISDGQGGSASSTVTMTVTQLAPGCTIALASQEASVVWGDTIHLSAVAQCNTGPAQIQWQRRIPGGALQTFLAFGDNNASITVTAQDIGANQFTAQARTKGTAPIQATSNTVSVSVADTVASCTAVRLTAPLNTAHVTAGSPVTLTASATCPPDITPEYQYWIKQGSAANWTVLSGYTQGSGSFSFPTAGAWSVSAVARSVGSHVNYQVRTTSVGLVVDSAP